MLADELRKEWRERRASTAIDVVMRLADEGLVFGAGTVLVAAGESRRDVSIDPLEPNLSALLTAAHLRTPTFTGLMHLRKAGECWRGGDEALAAMHLALSGLDRLSRPEADAQRLFLADRLLRAGFGPDVIVGAVSKYSPDQPRVPAGSGRASGQWTSSNGNASIGAPSDTRSEITSSPGTASSPAPASRASPPQPPQDRRRPEVNADTVTEVAAQQYETRYACKIAYAHCIDAALEASAHDPANDNNPRLLDLDNCKSAAEACQMMSWAMQYQPLPLGGGVRFPNGGLVLIYKDQVDRYVPPLYGGEASLKRNPEILREMRLRKVRKIDNYSTPSRTPTPDEITSPNSARFSACDQVISWLSNRTGGRILDKTYSISEHWGTIIRAKVAFGRGGSHGSASLTCWSGSGSDVQFDLTFDCCAGCGER